MRKTALALLCLSPFVLAPVRPVACQETPRITTREVGDHMNRRVTVCGGVFAVQTPPSNIARPTLVKLGGPYPNRIVTVVIGNSDRHEFPEPPEVAYANDDICVTGTLRTFDFGPAIPITGPEAVRPWDRDSGEPAWDPSGRR